MKLVMAALCSCAFLTTAIQAEEIEIKGKLSYFEDIESDIRYEGYSYSIIFNYDPETPVFQVTNNDNYDEGLFRNSGISLEYTIYDWNNNPVTSNLIDGFIVPGNDTRVVDSRDPSLDDRLSWIIADLNPDIESRVLVELSDSSRRMIQSVTNYPYPPLTGDFDGSNVLIQYSSSISNFTIGHNAEGTVTSISYSDPLRDCEISAGNHGQYISCVVHLFFKTKLQEKIVAFSHKGNKKNKRRGPKSYRGR